MNDSRLVSVVMPTYNGSKFIAGAIDSILSQTYKNFEFIIVDDGSTDNTSELIKSFKDDRIKYIFQENKGPVYAYNTGFRNSIGKYVFVQDHDDESKNSRIELQLEYCIKNKLDICGSYFTIQDLKQKYRELISLPTQNSNIIKILLYKPWVMFNPTVCIKKDIFQEFGYYNENYKVGYDYEFFIRNIGKVNYGNIPSDLYSWTRKSNSFGHKHIDEGNSVQIKLSTSKIDLLKDSFSKSELFFYKGMAYFYANSPVNAAKNHFLSVAYGNEEKRAFWYFLSIVLLWPIIIWFRKKGFFSHPKTVVIKRKIFGTY